MEIILWILWVILSCYALMIVCDEFFVKSLDVISKKWKLSDNVAWATIMAVGTSAPEFFTALMALFSWGKIWLGAGTIIGSAIFNILCITGWSALFLNAVLKKAPFLRDSIFYGAFIVLILVSFWDGKIVWMEALAYIGLYIGYILYLIKDNKKHYTEESLDVVAQETVKIEEQLEKKIWWLQYIDKVISMFYPHQNNIEKKYVRVFWMSIAWILFLSRLLVQSGVALAQGLWVSEVIIGLTVLAAGTSVPDLLSSVIVAKQGRGDMAVANALGSNIFDIGICLGLPWVLYLAFTQSPIPVKSDDLMTSIIALFLVLGIVVGTLIFTKYRINRNVGILFIGSYIMYLVWVIWMSVV